jgi:ABC-type multidrug transport system fused ATPase/permease subunit
MGGDVSVGDLTALIVFINLLYRPLRQLADRFNTLQMGMVASERVLKLVNDTDEKEISGKYHQNRVSGDVKIENLSFAYSKKEWILKDINVKISSGQTYALVGATGSGKSTLVHLLLGYYQHQKGSILLDGMDLKKWSLNSLRKNVSLVQQDVFLFSDSVRNNVTVYRDVKDDDIWKAAEDMGIKDFISSLPGGLDYDVKERGGMLSTGQRQLLAFLRAYLNNPSLLVLDEATSSIDSQAEKWIQRATQTLTKGRTSIVVAHRLATVVNADHIIVLDKGKIVEEGTHKSLLKRSGYYQNLFNKQFFDSQDSI